MTHMGDLYERSLYYYYGLFQCIDSFVYFCVLILDLYEGEVCYVCEYISNVVMVILVVFILSLRFISLYRFIRLYFVH